MKRKPLSPYDALPFGKYKNSTLADEVDGDPGYFEWLDRERPELFDADAKGTIIIAVNAKASSEVSS